MRKVIFALMLSLFVLTGVNAEYRVYDNVTDFENAKGGVCETAKGGVCETATGGVCETATDGCNTYFITDGKVMGGTEMFCEDNKVEWNCTKFKDNVMTTRSLMITTTSIDEAVACTMEYAPVCGVDGKTYSNRCGAEAAAKVIVDYEGACVVKKGLGINDTNFYNTIKKRLSLGYQYLVNKTVIKYKNRINKLSNINKEELNNKIISKIETKISDLLSKYPQDIALPQNINDKYLTYVLLKFELMKLKF